VLFSFFLRASCEVRAIANVVAEFSATLSREPKEILDAATLETRSRVFAGMRQATAEYLPS
jgi:hypothetical protein